MSEIGEAVKSIAVRGLFAILFTACKPAPNKSEPAVIIIPTPVVLPFAPTPDVPSELNTALELSKAVTSFTWEDASDPESLRALSWKISDVYLGITESGVLTSEKLHAPTTIQYFSDTNAFIDAVRKVQQNFNPRTSLFGYTDYSSGQIFINLESLKGQAGPLTESAGLSILDAQVHEMGHLDVKPRLKGELLNDPKFYFISPLSGVNEPFREFRGMEIFTDTYWGMSWFEEVMNETVTVRFMMDKIGLKDVISAGDYYRNGVDVLLPLTQKAGFSFEDLYGYHASSDLVGFAKRIGALLPGDSPDLDKGLSLFVAIHQADPALMEATGVYDVLDDFSK